MLCRACQHANDPCANFCEACGSRLARVCASCEASLNPDAKFCSACGVPVEQGSTSPPPSSRRIADYTPKHLAEKILRSRSALEGERKQVTVLFADVKGSMGLASRLDPEDWHGILDRYFAILNEEVHRFEGTINQYTGDGIMALFGAPIAHEDHARRACYAALRMRDALRRFSVALRVERGVDFSTRIGINSGEVVVGRIGDDLRMDYTAQGHTVGVAQRLEAIAESGHIYVSGNTAHLVEGFFKLSDLGVAEIANVAEPVRVFDLEDTTAARSRIDVARQRGLTRFVGRHDEMDVLKAALERARSGFGQVVGIVGEPGLGKSRLCFEFTEACRAADIPVYEAHCPAHGKSIPFIPILELYRNFFDISDKDKAAQARQKIAGALTLLDPTMYPALPVLFEFLGVADPDSPAAPVEADARQRQLFGLLHKIARAQNERAVASVVLFDDLHWIDKWSDEFVAQLVEVAQTSHLLLLVNFRPEYHAGWTVKPHYQQLPLVPLGASAVRELVAGLLGTDAGMRPLTERIMQWTGGNPLFAEEVINNLIETGQLTGTSGAYRLSRDVGALEVPATVQAILAARIDRLDETAKQLLHGAAVIGMAFSHPLLERMTELSPSELPGAVERLKAADFIYEVSLYPTTEYSFKHPLVHEVAYDTQLNEQRKLRHRRVAEAIESLEAARLDEAASMLAYHWERVGALDKSLYWHRRAALVSQANDLYSAVEHWVKVRALVDEHEPTPEILSTGAEACGYLNALRWRVGGDEETARAYFQEGSAMAKRAGNKVLQATLVGNYGLFRGATLGYVDDYIELGREAVRIAADTDNFELQCGVETFHAWGHAYSGNWRQAMEIADAVRAKMPASDGFGERYAGGTTIAFSVDVALGLGLFFTGDTAGGLELVRRAGTHAISHADWRVVSRGIEGFASGLLGDLDVAAVFTREAVDDAEAAASNFARTAVLGFAGAVQYMRGEYENAELTLRRSLEIMDRDKLAGAHRGVTLGYLANVATARGDVVTGLRTAQSAVEFCDPRHLYWCLEPWLALARAQDALGNTAAARETLQHTQKLIARTGAVFYRGRTSTTC